MKFSSFFIVIAVITLVFFDDGLSQFSVTSVNPNIVYRLDDHIPLQVNGTGFTPTADDSIFYGITIHTASVSGSTVINNVISVSETAPIGSRTVYVNNRDAGGHITGIASLPGGLEVQNPVPTITSINPNQASVGTTLDVTITGTKFINNVTLIDLGADITVNSVSVSVGNLSLQANITIASSAVLGQRNVVVTNPSPGGSATLTNGFTVLGPPATVTVLSPNGGETIYGGTNYNITWSSQNIATVMLEYSLNNGGTWTTINTSTSATTGSYIWTVPVSLTSQGRVRVSEANNATVNDVSDDAFTIRLGTISGIKFFDGNANGVRDRYEKGLSGWTINLSGDATTATMTNERGEYKFENIPPGSYTVSEEQRTGWMQTFPTGGNPHSVTLFPGQDAIDKNFGNAGTATIAGFKFKDADNDGTYDNGETKLSRWNMKIDPLPYGNNYAYTDGNGNYSFKNLPPANYTVQEVIPFPKNYYTPTKPNSEGAYLINIAGGENLSDIDFGNFAQDIKDLNVTIGYAPQRICCNTTFFYVVTAMNLGTVDISGVYLEIQIPNQLEYLGYSRYSPYTALRKFGSFFLSNSITLKSRERLQFIIRVRPTCTTPPVSPLLATAKVFPVSGDQTQSNNTNESRLPIRCGGLAKMRGPLAQCTDGDVISPDDSIIYVISFQNPTSDTVSNLVIEDTLDADIDTSSVTFLGSSHDAVLEQSGNALRWSLTDINLTSIGGDEAGSIGYVMFSVKPTSGIPDNTQINHFATLYFDLEDPIVTDEETHTVTTQTLPTADFTASAESINVGQTVDFMYSGTTVGDLYYWEFGEHAIPETSTEQNPAGIQFNEPGTIAIAQFTITGSCTSDAAIKYVTVLDTNLFRSFTPESLVTKVKKQLPKLIKRRKGIPTITNVIEEVVTKGGFAPGNTESDYAGGMRVGISFMDEAAVNKWKVNKDSAKVRAWVRLSQWDFKKERGKNYTDIQKTLEDRIGLHTGTARGFDSLFSKGKPRKKFVGQKTKLTPTDHNNHLFAELVALKVGIAASQLGITPERFGELTYISDDEFNGMSVVGLSSYVDYALTYWEEENWNFQLLDSIITKINIAFTGPITASDTISFVNDNFLKLRGVRGVRELGFLETSTIPTRRVTPRDALFEEGEKDDEGISLPKKFSLYQAYPNPFNPSTMITFDLPENAFVTLKVYDVLGREVAILTENQQFEAGTYELEYNASNFASGLYFYRISVFGQDGILSYTDMKKIILMR
ncbi:MAG: T9SS type A sorting domain-containing protein [Ignavibacteriae bacterium]|nr:T9SS type A sorting domain-containing protein [Ignavibacteriota bacterium]